MGCAIGERSIFDLYCFGNDDGQTVTINSERYINMLRNASAQLFSNRMGRLLIVTTVHCQVLETVHFRGQVNFLKDRQSIISIFPTSELPRLPILGLPKDRVYKVKPPTIERLKENIKREIKGIPAYILERIIDNFNARLAGVIQRHVTWIKHFIYY